MTISVFTDGGARGNPGPAAIGIVAFDDDKELFTHGEYIGETTNNDAEYGAVVWAMSKLKDIAPTLKEVVEINFFSDSQLLVNQLNGLYKVKNARISEHIAKIHILKAEINAPVSFHHIPREQNKRADWLVNEALDRI